MPLKWQTYKEYPGKEKGDFTATAVWHWDESGYSMPPSRASSSKEGASLYEATTVTPLTPPIHIGLLT